MNDKFEKLITPLREILTKETLKFLMSYMNDEEKIGDIIDLIMSSHMNSMCSLMRLVTLKDKESSEKTDQFISALNDFFETAPNITSVTYTRK